MVKRITSSDDYDSPWKIALLRYLRLFLAFFYPRIHDDIDWSRGYEALDKEFQQIIRRAAVGKGFADMLFKVWLKGGEECWLFIHIDIQASYDKDFPRRMFEYNTAVHKLYNREVVGLAILCDERPEWRPTGFGYGRWGARTEISFLTVKLLDYADDLQSLETDANPFAMVVLAHLQARATRRQPVERRAWKFRLVRGLYERKLSKADVFEFFRVVDWILDLPEDLQEQFREDLHRYEEEKKMPYISSLEQMALQEGHKEGRAIGLREGILEGIALALDRFGQGGRQFLAKARRIKDVGELRRLSRCIHAATSLQELRQQLR